MQYNSKSLLDTMTIGRLQFECQNVADWITANSMCMTSDVCKFLPVDLLGTGHYGTALRLRNFPGLVLKLCRSECDGYPEWIRSVVHAKRRERWMPQVFLYGGKEGHGGCFWCVLPEYTNPWGHDAHYTDQRFSDAWPFHAKSLVFHWEKSEAFFAARRLPREDRRQLRRFKQFLKDSGLEACGGLYMHAGNALKDGEQWIITDPIAGMYDEKPLINVPHPRMEEASCAQ